MRFKKEEELLDPTLELGSLVLKTIRFVNRLCRSYCADGKAHPILEQHQENKLNLSAPPNSLTYPSDSSISNPIQPSLTITK
ncbi:hypothetical protein BY996DRAFT_6486781 [Phakopsora pachyrhizi]|nr:hypothetical protein BY996DRAFT_6486781 [Phakopsora pachyrhizi]